jgi:hypothetical protein
MFRARAVRMWAVSGGAGRVLLAARIGRGERRKARCGRGCAALEGMARAGASRGTRRCPKSGVVRSLGREFAACMTVGLAGGRARCSGPAGWRPLRAKKPARTGGANGPKTRGRLLDQAAWRTPGSERGLVGGKDHTFAGAPPETSSSCARSIASACRFAWQFLAMNVENVVGPPGP